MRSHKILLVIIVIAVLWIFGQLHGIGQKQENPQKWTVETHDNTNFPLIGKHRTTSCRDCHLNLVFEGTPRECEACHWERRQDDRYQLRLGTHCDDCHTPYSWKNVSPNKWNHAAAIGYPLEGMHRTLDCADCHGDHGFDSLNVACFDCHAEEYRETQEPDHRTAGFPTQCQLCHFNQNVWSGAVFSHDRFRLRGVHKTISCSDCHSSGQYTGLSTACVSCHLDDYNRADDPDHKALGFPTDCEICHGRRANTWEDGKFSHMAYPLTGQHTVAKCSDCHPEGIYAGTSSDCVSCHLDEYDNTTDPDHKAMNFSTDCISCHGNSFINWQTVTFDHSAYWILQGAHTNLNCSNCHAQGYNLPRDCFGCHAQDYNDTTSPDHATAGFPPDCELCHYPTHFSWSQAVFDHRFPINSGKHSNADCTDCHLTSNFREFSCLSCHQHNKTRMDNKHQGVTGYVYDSLACYSCHPQGRE